MRTESANYFSLLMGCFRKAFLCLILCLLAVGCVSTEYRQSEEAFQRGAYSDSLKYIELAVQKEPKNDLYLKQKEKIIGALNEKRMATLMREYRGLATEQLEAKAAKINEICELANNIGDKPRIAYCEAERITLQATDEEIKATIRQFHSECQQNKFQEALEKLLTLKKYYKTLVSG